MSNTEALSVAVYYHRRILEESCQVEGFGQSGCFVHMNRPMPVATPLVIRFRSGDRGVGPALPCKVEHVEEISSRAKTGRSGVNVSFAELEEEILEFVGAVVEGTDPAEAGADFPEQADFTLPEPPIPGEVKEPQPAEKAPVPETTDEPEQQAGEDETDTESPSEAASQAPPEEEGEAQNAPDEVPEAKADASASGEIGTDHTAEEPDHVVEDQPSVVLDAGDSQPPEQMELPDTRLVSGEIGGSAHEEPAVDQPSVVVGELVTEPAPQETAPQESDAQDETAAAQTEDKSSEDDKQEEEPPKKKKRRRGRRKKKSNK